MGYPSADLLARLKYMDDPIKVSLSSTSARNSVALDRGVYQVTCNADAFVLQGGSTVVAVKDAGSESVPLWNKTYVTMYVEDPTTEGYIAAVLSSGTGTMYIVKRR